MKTHKDLLVWQKSISFVTSIYQITKEFPKEENYGIINQMRRAAVSVPSNIAEGAARSSKKEFVQFLHISLGSLSELETQLIISKNLEYLGKEETDTQLIKLIEIRKMLLGLLASIEKRDV